MPRAALLLFRNAFQSTRPRGARPTPVESSRRTMRVSIHAPARGATGIFRSLQRRPEHGFNPRAREGRDSKTGASRNAHHVSIHAPARGATSRKNLTNNHICSFNPRAREGRDFPCCLRMRKHQAFQSTRPRGARPEIMRRRRVYGVFQSTRPRGARRAACA